MTDPTPDQDTIMFSLGMYYLLTEHELVKAIADKTRQKDVEVYPKIGKLLEDLKDRGLVWAGRLHNQHGQTMWCSVLTKKGKEYVAAREVKN